MRMKYEHLVRKAFNCGRYGDPFGLANADVYDGNIIKVEHRLIFGISAALKKVAHDVETNNPDFASELEKLDDKIWQAKEQKDVIYVIEKGLELFDEHGIGYN
jgi:hypothetical protein